MSEEKANIGTPKPKLLIVDDDNHILEAFTLLFEDEYEVKTCQNLKEAVDLYIEEMGIPEGVGDEELIITHFGVKYAKTSRTVRA